MEDFGCSVPEDKHEFKFIFDTIQNSLNTVEKLIPADNELIGNSFKMVNEFVGAMSYFMMVISDDSSEYLDMYCRGMIFGNKGSAMLVRIANVVKNNDIGKAIDGVNAQTKRGMKKKSKGIFGALKDTWDEVGGSVVTEMIKQGTKMAAGKDGDL